MPDPEVWVIVSSLILNGRQQDYNPTVEFPDWESCRKTAASINKDWLQQRVVGFATCRRPPE